MKNRHIAIVAHPGTSPNTRTFVHVFPRKLPTEVVRKQQESISGAKLPGRRSGIIVIVIIVIILLVSWFHSHVKHQWHDGIMWDRTQLCKGAVGSFRHADFWVFLRFKPSTLNMLEDCFDLRRHDAPVLKPL